MNNKQAGQSLIEMLMALALCSILLPALITGLVASRQGKPQQNQRIAAINLLKETTETVRNIRETGWNNIATNGIYHPIVSGSNWSFASGSDIVNGLTRQIIVSDVFRNTNGAIVTNGGTVDPSTKKIVASVSWSTPFSTTIQSTLYFTRTLDNLSHIDTLISDFNTNGNVQNGVSVKQTTGGQTGDGEVTLAAGGGGGDWCVPSFSITTVDLSGQGIPTAISAVQGTIVTGTGGNASGPTFAKIAITGNSPPIATISGMFDNAKANGVFNDNNNFGYIATTNNSQEIQILDLTQFSDPPTNSKYKQVGYFDAPGNTQGNAIFVTNNIGYMTAGNKFYTFDLTSKTGSRPRYGSYTLTLAGTGNKIVVVGNYAYVAINSTTTQLQVINVTDPTNPSIVAQANVGNSQNGVDLAVNPSGTRAYLVTSYISGQNDFFIIDTSTKSGNLSTISTGYSTNGMSPRGVAIATGNRAIIVGTGGTQQYQVIKIDTIDTGGTPTFCAGLAITNGAYGISTVLQNDGYAYSYVVTGDANHELKIILGGAGGQFAYSGTYESPVLSVLNGKSAFNGFSATVSQPSLTTLKLQVASTNAVNGSCNGVTYSYVGPNGDANQYFTIGSNSNLIQGAIPLLSSGNYNNPGQCLRYKYYLTTTDYTASPILYDMTINYSP